MKIKNISSDYEKFRSIEFNNDFSVIVGDSQKSKNARSHNLGKTTIIRIIKFVLFNGSKTFLEKISVGQKDLNFYIKLGEFNREIIISRNMKRRKKGDPKEIETLVDYEYFIRFQNEFDLDSPFKKEKYRGGDVTWKPRLIGLLGFNKELMYEKLSINSEIKELETTIRLIQNSKITLEKNRDRINSLIDEKSELEKSLSELNLLKTDKVNIRSIVRDLDIQLHDLEITLFRLHKEELKIDQSLRALDSQEFDFSEIENIYNEANVYFSVSLQKDLEDLKSFSIKVSENRKNVLQKLKIKNELRMEEIESNLEKINKDKIIKLKSIMSVDSADKYKDIFSQLIEVEKELFMLKRDVISENIDELKKQLSQKTTESFKLSAKVSEEVDNNRRKFDDICSIYSKIVEETINIDSKIEILKRKTGNIDLELKSYRGNTETDELKGATAKKISSAAVDIAIRAIQNEDQGFIIQDGVIDEIDANAAHKFISVVKSLVNTYDFQYIMTAIKDSLPNNIDDNDIVIELNDYTVDGLLFGQRY